MNGIIEAVAKAPRHQLGKRRMHDIQLFAGLGVGGDAHAGATVKHQSAARRTPDAPNLRQVHLIHAELFEELATQGFAVGPGEIGENVTTRGIALLDLPCGTRLALGDTAVVELTGLRNPCLQLERLHPGLMAAVLGRDAEGGMIRKSGVMAIVVAGGTVRPGDAIGVTLPAEPHMRLAPV